MSIKSEKKISKYDAVSEKASNVFSGETPEKSRKNPSRGVSEKSRKNLSDMAAKKNSREEAGKHSAGISESALGKDCRESAVRLAPYIALTVFTAALLLLPLGNGDFFGSEGDWYSQHVGAAEALRQTMTEQETVFPQHIGLGGGSNAYDLAYYGLMRPDVLISCLLPDVPMKYIIAAYSLITAAASVNLSFMWLKRKDTGLWFSAAGAVMTAAAACFFHSHHQIMFVNYMPFLIMALIGIDVLFEKKKSLLIMVSVFMICIHSFFFAPACLAVCLIYFLYRMNGMKNLGCKNRLKGSLHVNYTEINSNRHEAVKGERTADSQKLLKILNSHKIMRFSGSLNSHGYPKTQKVLKPRKLPDSPKSANFPNFPKNLRTLKTPEVRKSPETLKPLKAIKSAKLEMTFKAAAAAACGVGMAAVLLLPTAMDILSTEKDGGSFAEEKISALNLSLDGLLYSAYGCGLTLLALYGLLLALWSRKLRAVSAAVLICQIIPLVSLVLSGFLYSRGKMLIPFLPLIVWICAETFEELWKGKQKNKLIPSALCFVPAFFSEWKPLIIAEAAVILIWTLFSYMFAVAEKRKKETDESSSCGKAHKRAGRLGITVIEMIIPRSVFRRRYYPKSGSVTSCRTSFPQTEACEELYCKPSFVQKEVCRPAPQEQENEVRREVSGRRPLRNAEACRTLLQKIKAGRMHLMNTKPCQKSACQTVFHEANKSPLKALHKTAVVLLLAVSVCVSFCTSRFGEEYIKAADVRQERFSFKETADIASDRRYRFDYLSDGYVNTNVLPSGRMNKTSIYSSVSNSAYGRFFYGDMKNPIAAKNRVALVAGENIFFNYFMGIKYLLAKADDIPYGYEKIAEKDGYVIAENENVLPVCYGAYEMTGEEEYEKLKFPDKLAALAGSEIKEIGAELEDDNIKLSETVEGEAVIVSFDIDRQDGREVVVSVEGVRNKLSGKDAAYPNKNYEFVYVLTSDKPLKNLKTKFSEGNYSVKNLKAYKARLPETDFVMPVFYSELKANQVFSGSLKMEKGGWFVTSYPYKKGYHIKADGKERKAEKVNTAFIGFPLEEGTHDVEITYTAPGFWAGLSISLLSFAGAAIIAGRERKKKS